MKKMNKNIIILIVAALLLGSSCQDFLSVNEVNPNNASKVPAKLMLPAALNSVARTLNNPRRFDFVYLWHGLWSISSGYSQPQNLVQYKLINSNYQAAFNEFYIAGQNFTVIEQLSKDPNECNYLALAKIMKAFIFQNLVDCWGDVPYTQAFKATEILKPKYDNQQAIYEDLVVQLDAAMALIQNAPVTATEVPVASDIMFGGDMGKWLKFANTLKLRILVHQSGMSGRDSYIKSNIANTASIGYIGAGEGGLVNPGYLVSDGQMNVFYETFYNAAGSTQSDGVTYYFAGMDAVDFLQATNDLRLGKFFQEYAAGKFAGNVLGTPVATALPQAVTSKLGYASGPEDPGTMIGTATKSAPLLTDFESLFIQAEAVQRGLMAGNAKNLYEGAITRSYIYMGLTSGDASNYLSQELSTVNYTTATDKLNLILTQKWASLNGIAPVEIWTDFRRTGIPTFIHWSIDPARLNPTPPVRLLYPQTEISTNNDNLLQVGAIDAFTSKIFWQNR
jgi:hypothetical protein